MPSINDENHLIALITGGSRGIGKEIAKKLAGEGFLVCIASRSQSNIDAAIKEISELGGEIYGFTADVSKPDDLKEMIKKIVADCGTVDILVNNAGIGDGSPFVDYDEERWWRLIEINLRGPMLLSQLVLKPMISNNFGIIVNMSSFASVRSGANSSAYTVSKTALNRLGDCIASSVDDNNIGVFNISPGLVRTDMTEGVPAFEDIPEEYWTPITAAAELVRKLATGKYNKLSGRFIHVNYDLEQMMDEADKIIEENLYQLRLPILTGLQE